MASAYNLEPQTNAKVILKTTHGDLDIELWTTQTPLTSRNFLQLCLDGYYTDTVFHRLVPDFILQGGDPTGTGHGGEAIYDGGLFEDEFHSRLRFNRRGLVGMANSGRKNDNGSQFFLTLGDTKELTGRNTMFGKVVGDTVFNLVRMGQGECEEGTEMPVYPVKVLGAEVVINPFEDMKPREAVKKTETLEDAAAAKAKKAAAKKKKGGKALLSFGGEEGEEESSAPATKKPKFNTRLVVATPLSEATKKQSEKSVPKPPTTGPQNTTTTTETVASVTTASKDSLADTPEPTKSAPPKPTCSSRSPTSSSEPPSQRSSLLAQTNAQIAALKQSLRRDHSSTLTSDAVKKPKKSLLSIQKEMLPPTSVKGRKRKRGKQREADDDEDAIDSIKRFQNKLSTAAPLPTENTVMADPTTHPTNLIAPDAGKREEKDVLDEDDESNLCDLHFIPHCASCGLYDRNSRSPSPDASDKLWSHTLSFEKDRLGKDLMWKKRNEELTVIDPREKEKEILGAKKGMGGEGGRGAFRKDGGGGGGTEWGRRRDGIGAGVGGSGGSGGSGGNGGNGGSGGRGGRGGRGGSGGSGGRGGEQGGPSGRGGRGGRW